MSSLAQQEEEMPELPEVEVTRQGLLPHLPGLRIVAARWSIHRLRTPIPRTLLLDHIVGKHILTIDRRAKYLLIRMEDRAVLLLHLGMTGKLRLVRKETGTHKHDHLILTFDDNNELRFNDSRRFGSIAVWPAHEANAREQEFSQREGLEPLSGDFTPQNLYQLARGRKIPIKAFLMNTRLIAGIGNIYANEILFAARIHPLTLACVLQRKEWGNIVTEGAAILQRAIAAGGSTISDFLGSNGHPGYFQLQLTVYDRKELPCVRCSRPVEKTLLSGRATYFCPGCQPFP